jgi:hypothetical protein
MIAKQYGAEFLSQYRFGGESKKSLDDMNTFPMTATPS